MYTKEEKEIAKGILANDDVLKLLAKVFLDEEDKLTTEVVSRLNNEELGQLVRASDLAEVKIKTRFNILKRLSDPVSSGGRGKVVPK